MNMPSILKSISWEYREDESEYQCELPMSCFELVLARKDTTFLLINHEWRGLRELFMGAIPTQQFNKSTLQQKK